MIILDLSVGFLFFYFEIFLEGKSMESAISCEFL